MLAAAPTDPLAPASITMLVKIRALVRRLREHASVTVVPGESGDLTIASATESYRLEPDGSEAEFLAQVYARYAAGGFEEICFTRHGGGAIVAHLSRRTKDEARAAQILDPLQMDQLARLTTQLAIFNEYLARTSGGEDAAGFELQHREFNS